MLRTNCAATLVSAMRKIPLNNARLCPHRSSNEAVAKAASALRHQDCKKREFFQQGDWSGSGSSTGYGCLNSLSVQRSIWLH